MFVDASAIVAILTREAEADHLADLLEGAAAPITSPIAVFEAVAGICRKRQSSVEEAHEDIRQFLTEARIRAIAISDSELNEALGAYSRYGKGRGHAAQLNLGDCFAYAVAKTQRVSILFKGDDFSRTDIPAAGQMKA